MPQQFNPHAFDDLIKASCTEFSAPVPLVRAQIQHESQWNPLTVGDGGKALGLMQVHRIAAEDVGMAAEWDDLQHVIEAQDSDRAALLSIKIGCGYLAKMLKEFKGAEAWAVAAYNQGPTVIAAAKRYAETVMALKGVA